MDFKPFVRNIPDFPKKGILFRDITSLLETPGAFSKLVHCMSKDWHGKIDAVAALDARGFIFGAPLALTFGVPLILVRKKGKLPSRTESISYALEYGEGVLEIHADAVKAGARVLVVDDLLATGGTAKATCDLIERVGGAVAGCAFAIELNGLGGRKVLNKYCVKAEIIYEEE